MPKFKMFQKVKILSSKKLDGTYIYGTVVGIELSQKSPFYGLTDEEMVPTFTEEKYKILFCDCSDSYRGCQYFTEWISSNELDNVNVVD